jgi:hypothetical protein
MPRRTAALAAASMLLLALAGCSTASGRGADAARAVVVDLLAPARFHSYAPDIVEFAERVEAATADSRVLMVGVEEGDASARDEGQAIGWLTLGLTVADQTGPSGYGQSPEDQDPGPHCFRVAFDHWGVAGIRGTGCPDPFVAVGAPPSSRPETAADAEEVIWSVLSALPAELPSEDEIAAQVTALLDPHPNGVTPLAAVTVHVEDGSVAVATGGPDDCVMVGRFADGEVRDVHVPSVYLQVGELGCVATTAFAGTRPPH